MVVLQAEETIFFQSELSGLQNNASKKENRKEFNQYIEKKILLEKTQISFFKKEKILFSGKTKYTRHWWSYHKAIP